MGTGLTLSENSSTALDGQHKCICIEEKREWKRDERRGDGTENKQKDPSARKTNKQTNKQTIKQTNKNITGAHGVLGEFYSYRYLKGDAVCLLVGCLTNVPATG